VFAYGAFGFAVEVVGEAFDEGGEFERGEVGVGVGCDFAALLAVRDRSGDLGVDDCGGLACDGGDGGVVE
jgi:hypothetical protein